MGASRRYSNSVFINCPFDGEYKRIFDALVFAVFDCGYVARCTLEIDDASRARIENILTIIGECKFGIHDISRTELSEGSGLPRFNMPLELGLFLGAARFGSGQQREKRCLVLDRERYRYQRYISDIAGQDIKSHDDDPEVAIARVRDWLNNDSLGSNVMMPGGVIMARRYERFTSELPGMCETLHLEPHELTFNDLANMVSGWLQENPWGSP